MANSDLDPQAFLKTVRDLSDRRQREDQERYEKLEAQVLQDRTARLERRLERQRSISPVKTPRSQAPRTDDVKRADGRSNISPLASPTRGFTRDDSLASFEMEPASSPMATERPASPTKSESPSAALPSRSNTMSWQKRPQSGVRARPLSALAAENASRSAGETSPDSQPVSRDEPSQQDIAKTLSTKDPSWFRQTPDRGVSSAAYRRQRDDEADPDVSSERRHLPGLNGAARVTSPTSQSPADRLPSASVTTDRYVQQPPSPERTPARPGSTVLEPTPEHHTATFARAAPNLQSRANMPNRSPSPTKGMGGFVESAMMKRTESVSKRWSNQPTGLGRQDSTASLRSPLGSLRSGVGTSFSMPKLDDAQPGAETANSRPSSRHGIDALGDLPSRTLNQSPSPTRQHGSFHSRSKSHASLRDSHIPDTDVPPTFSPPLSPSKRWRSPTKSSWLESALARPESPTKQMTPQSVQPSWMTDLTKAKQQRESVTATPLLDDFLADTGEASVPIEQAAKTSTTNPMPPVIKSSSRKVTPSDNPKRDFTPPLKPKPKPEAVTSSAATKRNAFVTPSHSPLEAQDEFTPSSIVPTSDSRDNRDVVSPPSRLVSLNGINKPKLSPPVQVDFRSNLKSRPTSGDQSVKTEPEFRDAMGKLKKATTQNYAAPDVLKNNILRGKAGLTVTGGPQKTVRVDEFKESILQKKAEMKEKAPEPGLKPGQKAPVPTPVPEALQVKKGLQRSDSSAVAHGQPNAKRDITPEALARHKTLRGKPGVPPGPKPSKLSDAPEIAPFQSKTSVDANTASAAEPLARRSKSGHVAADAEIQAKTTQNVSMRPQQGDSNVESQAGTSTQAKSSAFADRFNPALAGLLARGPPLQKPSSAGDESRTTGDNTSSSLSRTTSPPQSTTGELTHMTKDRARGPKRRKPKLSQATTESISSSMEKREVPVGSNATTPTKTPIEPRPKSAAVRTLSAIPAGASPGGRSPATPTKSATFPLQSPSVRSAAQADSNGRPSVSNLAPSTTGDTSRKAPAQLPGLSTASRSGVMTSNGDTSAVLDDNKENTESASSVKDAATRWGKSATPKSATIRNEPVKLPSRHDEDELMRSAGLLKDVPVKQKSSKPEGLGIYTSAAQPAKSPLTPPSSGGLPSRPAKSSRVVSQTLGESTNVAGETNVLTPRADGGPPRSAQELLQKHFGAIPRIASRLELDAQSVVSNSAPEAGRTLRKTIHLLGADGNLTAIPTEKEYILFSGSTYIVTHVFGSATGQRQTDVFLWAGHDVSDSAIDQAQVTAKRIAKEVAAGARIVPEITLIREAMEPASFFQALGGIVIVRRGSHANAATKPYLLCGRPHAGHIAFDEVDFDLSLLYSAFPFILVKPTTIQNTQVFLWKGRGCSPETIGSARLISMDLASSDVVEVDEGKETPAFMSMFDGKTSDKPSNSSMKISGKVIPRLFRFNVSQPRRNSSSFLGFFSKTSSSSQSRPSITRSRPNSSASDRAFNITPPENKDATIQITEVSPFSQDDFEPEHVYLLDSIDSVLIIPGPLLVNTAAATHTAATASSPEVKLWEHLFAQACLFGNDYAMLAAGLQDRSSVPRVRVLLGDLSRENKMLFRRWDERRGLWGAAGLMAGARGASGQEMLEVADVLDCCAR